MYMFHQLNKLIRLLIRLDNYDRATKSIESCRIGDNKLYKIIKNRKRTTILPLKDENNKQIVSDKDKAQQLAKYFRQAHNNPLGHNDMIFTMGVEESVRQYLRCELNTFDPINSRQVHETSRSLKRGKAPGIDNISQKFVLHSD